MPSKTLATAKTDARIPNIRVIALEMACWLSEEEDIVGSVSTACTLGDARLWCVVKCDDVRLMVRFQFRVKSMLR
jgi:hypothetical protein